MRDRRSRDHYFFFFNDTATTEIYTLSLHDAPPIWTPQIPQLVCEPAELVGKLQPVPGKPLTYQTKGVGRPADVTLSPLYKLHYQRYSVYWNLISDSDGKSMPKP